MAKAVEFRQYTPQNSRDDLARRIEQIPADHAEALLAAAALLQKVHDAGLLSLASGLLNAGGTIIDHLADVADSPQAIAGLRTALILGSLLNTLDASELEEAMRTGERDASILRITRGLLTRESLVAAQVGVNLLNVIGRALLKQNAGKP